MIVESFELGGVIDHCGSSVRQNERSYGMFTKNFFKTQNPRLIGESGFKSRAACNGDNKKV